MKIFRYQRPRNLLEAFFSFTPYSTKKEWGKKEFVIKVEANPNEYLASLYCEDVIIAQLLYNIPSDSYHISLLMTSLKGEYYHRNIKNDSIFRTLKSLVRGLREYLGVKNDIDLTTAYVSESLVIPLLKIGDIVYRSYLEPYSKYTYNYDKNYFIFEAFRFDYDSFSFSRMIDEMFNIRRLFTYGNVLSSQFHLETDEGKSVIFYTDALPYIMFSSDKEIEEAYKELDKQIEEISRLWYEFHRKDAKKSEETFKKLREFISSHFDKIFTPDIFFRDYYGVWLNYYEKRDVLLRKVNFASKIIENVVIPEIKKELVITEILLA
jgi:hypothetical protein